MEESMPVVPSETTLPEIAPMEVEKKEYMTEKRKIAIANARKARTQKIAIRNANKGRAERALKGIKSIFQALKKRQEAPCPKCGGGGPDIPPAPSAPEPKGMRQREGVPKLFGGPKLSF